MHKQGQYQTRQSHCGRFRLQYAFKIPFSIEFEQAAGERSAWQMRKLVQSILSFGVDPIVNASFRIRANAIQVGRVMQDWHTSVL
jgi:hypothetical protein